MDHLGYMYIIDDGLAEKRWVNNLIRLIIFILNSRKMLVGGKNQVLRKEYLWILAHKILGSS